MCISGYCLSDGLLWLEIQFSISCLIQDLVSLAFPFSHILWFYYAAFETVLKQKSLLCHHNPIYT